MDELNRRFDQDGFVLVPGVLSREEVGGLRRLLAELFDSDIRHEGDGKNSRGDIFCRYPELRWLLAHAPIVSALRSILGEDFIYVHEMAAHDSFFARWHKDTTSPERAGHTFPRQPNYLMLQAALYLQDSGEYGGGLDVVPGSHQLPDLWSRTRATLRRRGMWPQERLEGYSIPNRAGDLVLFHLRMSHRATVPRVEVIPPERRKLAIFIACSANNGHVESYMKWLSSRGSPWLKDHAYSEEMLEFASKHGVRLG